MLIQAPGQTYRRIFRASTEQRILTEALLYILMVDLISELPFDDERYHI